MKWNKAKTLLY